jgi:hypothetical protein
MYVNCVTHVGDKVRTLRETSWRTDCVVTSVVWRYYMEVRSIMSPFYYMSSMRRDGQLRGGGAGHPVVKCQFENVIKTIICVVTSSSSTSRFDEIPSSDFHILTFAFRNKGHLACSLATSFTGRVVTLNFFASKAFPS